MFSIVQTSRPAAANNETRRGLYETHLKRAADIVLVLLTAPITLPLVLLLWIAVRLDGGPGLFRQARIGRDGRVFDCLKLRSMRTDAREALDRHLAASPSAAAEWKRDRKLRSDPRITPFGNILRRSSLDELPQLWNILRGDMSIVGPRPIVREELALYGTALPDYLAGRPGLTGLWQVSGRNSVAYESRVLLDRSYRRSISLWLDLSIMVRTARVVLRGTGC